jgi:hypothetical protein
MIQRKEKKMDKINGLFKSTGSRRWAKCIILTGLVLFAITGQCMAQSEEKVTTEEILDILKDKGIVTGEQYEELKKKAEQEKKESRKRLHRQME